MSLRHNLNQLSRKLSRIALSADEHEREGRVLLSPTGADILPSTKDQPDA